MRYDALIAALMIYAGAGFAAPPPIKYELDSDFQQEQPLPDQDFVQGAGAVLQYSIKADGKWVSLAGLGARWDARSSVTSTQAYQATASVVTSATPNYFEVGLTDAQTGTALTNWHYRLIVTSGGRDYPIGIGDVDIAASAWTGAAAILTTVTAQSYTDAAISNHAAVVATTNSIGHVKPGAGLTIGPDGTLYASGAAPAWGDVTGKPFTNLVDLTTANLTGIDWSLYVTGTPWTAMGYLLPASTNGWTVTSHAGLATGTPVYVESDPVWSSEKTGYVATTDATYTQTVALADAALPKSWTNETGTVQLGRTVKTEGAANVDTYGAAFGSGTTAWAAGAAFGSLTVAGQCGFAAGSQAKGADGSFVFADFFGVDFDRSAYPNEFGVRASGGIYFDTPSMVVTGNITAASITLGGTTITNLNRGTSGAYIVPYASTASIGYTYGSQYYAPTGTTTITFPAAASDASFRRVLLTVNNNGQSVTWPVTNLPHFAWSGSTGPTNAAGASTVLIYARPYSTNVTGRVFGYE